MPRQARAAPGGFVYHALNRAVARLPLLQKDGDYEAFERVLVEAVAKHPIRLLSYALMPNQWHLVLWPAKDGDMTEFLRWLTHTHTHTQRWHAHYHTAGTGHVYQGRFKAFPVQEDHHLYTVLRYVERNALRAGLVERAEQMALVESGPSPRRRGRSDPRVAPSVALAVPHGWEARVNAPETKPSWKRSVLL
jgi:putative transposase